MTSSRLESPFPPPPAKAVFDDKPAIDRHRVGRSKPCWCDRARQPGSGGGGDLEGFYVASVPALAGCHTQAWSLDELMGRIKEAIEL